MVPSLGMGSQTGHSPHTETEKRLPKVEMGSTNWERGPQTGKMVLKLGTGPQSGHTFPRLRTESPATRWKLFGTRSAGAKGPSCPFPGWIR